MFPTQKFMGAPIRPTPLQLATSLRQLLEYYLLLLHAVPPQAPPK